MHRFKKYLIEVFDKESIDKTPVNYHKAQDSSYPLISLSDPNGEREHRIKTHNYTYPTFTDIQGLRDTIKRYAQDGLHERANHYKNVLENIYSPEHRKYHSGSVIIDEIAHKHGEADVLFSEGGEFSRYGDHPYDSDDSDDNSVSPILKNLSQAAALHTFRHVAAAIKHFTSLPTRPWTSAEVSSSDKKADVKSPFKITNPDEHGKYILSGSTRDRRKHKFYSAVARLLGHKFHNYDAANLHNIIPPTQRKRWNTIPEGP